MKKEEHLADLENQIILLKNEIKNFKDSIEDSEIELQVLESAKNKLDQPIFAMKFKANERTLEYLDSDINRIETNLKNDKMLLENSEEKLKFLKIIKATAKEYEDYDE